MSKFLTDFLAANSTEKYFIQYGGVFSNHLAQGSIALHRLGATPERIRSFVDYYRRNLEPKSMHEDSNNEDLRDEADANRLLGKETDYYKILRFYEKELKVNHGGSLDSLINARLPKLVLGLSGAAFHGWIMTGYGFSVRNARIVCEGLAWMHYSYLPLENITEDELRAPLEDGSMEPLEIMHHLRESQALEDISVKGQNTTRGITPIPFLQRFIPLMLEGRSLFEKFKMLKNPIPSDASPTGAALGTAAFKLATTVYLLSEYRNDFCLLHGVTSSWALRQLLGSVEDEVERLRCYRIFMVCLLGVYIAERSPELHLKYLADAPGVDTPWSAIIEKGTETNYDEHMIKIVQVCHDMTAEDPENEKLYKLAAICGTNHRMFFA